MEDEPMNELAKRIEAMIAIQMASYPDWPEEEKREMAMQHLGFLEGVA